MKELFAKWLHKKVHVYLGGLSIAVVIMDIKQAYGKNRFLVSPAQGKGEIWVESFAEFN